MIFACCANQATHSLAITALRGLPCRQSDDRRKLPGRGMGPGRDSSGRTPYLRCRALPHGQPPKLTSISIAWRKRAIRDPLRALVQMGQSFSQKSGLNTTGLISCGISRAGRRAFRTRRPESSGPATVLRLHAGPGPGRTQVCGAATRPGLPQSRQGRQRLSPSECCRAAAAARRCPCWCGA